MEKRISSPFRRKAALKTVFFRSVRSKFIQSICCIKQLSRNSPKFIRILCCKLKSSGFPPGTNKKIPLQSAFFYSININKFINIFNKTALSAIFLIFPETHSREIPVSLEETLTLSGSSRILSRIQEGKKEVTKLIMREKWREYLPKAGINYFSIRNLNQNQNDSLYQDIRVSLNQLIYDGGENFRAVETAKLNELLNEQDFRMNLFKNRLDVRRVYIRAIVGSARLFTAEKSRERSDKLKTDILNEYRNGLRTKIEVLDAESKFRASELALQKSRSDYRLSVFELQNQTGISESIVPSERLFWDYIFLAPAEGRRRSEIFSMKDRPDLKKADAALMKAKLEKENAENYWKPKFYIGGYAGKNSNDGTLPKHETYGLNFSLVLPFGSSSSQTNGNFGVQKDGTGIQRIPNYGPQFVGQGENSFFNSNLGLFENFTHSRKILEGEIQMQEIQLQKSILEKQLETEKERLSLKLDDVFSSVRTANSRLALQFEILRVTSLKMKNGQARKLELMNAESEFLKSADELAEALGEYLKTAFEFQAVLGIDAPCFFADTHKDGSNILLKKMIDGSGRLLLENKDILNDLSVNIK